MYLSYKINTTRCELRISYYFDYLLIILNYPTTTDAGLTGSIQPNFVAMADITAATTSVFTTKIVYKASVREGYSSKS